MLNAAIYDIPWYLTNKSCRTNVNIILGRLQTEVDVNIGGFMPVNLRTLTSVRRKIANMIRSYLMLTVLDGTICIQLFGSPQRNTLRHLDHMNVTGFL